MMHSFPNLRIAIFDSDPCPGDDKGRDPSDKRQEREIKRARKSLEDWGRQEKARKRAK
jgi:hypothetical protein